jgi:hypothetical protein
VVAEMTDEHVEYLLKQSRLELDKEMAKEARTT